MERSGFEGGTDGGVEVPVLSCLVELVVAVSDETDDLWEIDDRVDAALRAGGLAESR